MPTTTPNLGLTKDAEGEPYSLARINANSDRIDTFAGEALTDTVYDTTGTPALIKKRKIAGVETPVTIETPDTVPTEGSNHLITSDAVHAALGSKQDALSQSQLAAANSGIDSTKVEQIAKNTVAIGVVANSGAKNLFDINAIPVKYHTTFTLTDGVLSGTSNGDWASYNVPVNLSVGNYIFSAVISNFSCDSGAGEGTIRIRITDSISGGTTIGTTNITGNGAISIPFSWSGGQFYIQYSFNFSSTGSYVNSFTASNSMIRPASITDSTFQPYAKTNRELTVAEDEDRAALIQQVDEGAKNKLKNSAVTQTVGEVVYTVNSDGTVSAYTTATTTASRTLTITLTDDNCYVNAGDLITGNPNTALDVAIQYGIGDSGNIANYIPSEQYHVIAVSGYIRYCLISIRSGISISQSSPLVFKPMICTAQDWAISQKFVPYRPSWQEMYQMILALQSGTRSAPALAMTAEPEEIRTEPDEIEPETGEEETR